MTDTPIPGTSTIQRYERDSRRLVGMFAATAPDADPWPMVLGSPGFLVWIERYLATLTSRATVRRYRAALLAIARTMLGEVPEGLLRLPTACNRAAAEASRVYSLWPEEWTRVHRTLDRDHWLWSPWGAYSVQLLQLTLTIGVLPSEWSDASLIHSEESKTLVIPAQPPRRIGRALNITKLEEQTLTRIDSIINARDKLGREAWRQQVSRVSWYLRRTGARLGGKARTVTVHAARQHFADMLAAAGWRAKHIAQALGLVRPPKRRTPLHRRASASSPTPHTCRRITVPMPTRGSCSGRRLSAVGRSRSSRCCSPSAGIRNKRSAVPRACSAWCATTARAHSKTRAPAPVPSNSKPDSRLSALRPDSARWCSMRRILRPAISCSSNVSSRRWSGQPSRSDCAHRSAATRLMLGRRSSVSKNPRARHWHSCQRSCRHPAGQVRHLQQSVVAIQRRQLHRHRRHLAPGNWSRSLTRWPVTSAVDQPYHYEPEITPFYQELTDHYYGLQLRDVAKALAANQRADDELQPTAFFSPQGNL